MVGLQRKAFGYGFQQGAEWSRPPTPPAPAAAAIRTRWSSTSATIRSARLIDEADKVGKKPLLWDESYGPYQGAFYDHADLYLDPGIRDYYVEPLIACYRKFIESKVVQGSQIWAWADDMFCPPNMSQENGRGWIHEHFSEELYRIAGRGLCGDAPWGVVDSWRSKPEFWIVKKLHTPVKLPETPLPMPERARRFASRCRIFYDFTDLSELKIDWQLGSRKGTLKASLPPRTAGESLIDAGTPAPGDVLAVNFRNAKGQLVDCYRLPIGKAMGTPADRARAIAGAAKDLQPHPLERRHDVRQRHKLRLGFGHTYGTVRRGVGYGVPILWESAAAARGQDRRHHAPLDEAERMAAGVARSEK